MGRYETIVTDSIGRLETHGWVVGPSLEAEEWRRRLNLDPPIWRMRA